MELVPAALHYAQYVTKPLAYYNTAKTIYDTANNMAKRFHKSKYSRKRPASSSGSRRTKRTRRTGYGGVTAQHDAKNVYVKKTMPKYKRRSWKKFVKKVQAVNEGECGTHKIMFNEGFNLESSYNQLFRDVTKNENQTVNVEFIAKEQGVSAVHLYGGQRGAGTYTGYNMGVEDLQRITESYPNEFELYNIANARNTLQPTTKMKFISAVLDTTFTNTNGTIPLEVDCYHIVYNKTWVNDLVVNPGVVGNSSYQDFMNQYAINFGNNHIVDIANGGKVFRPRIFLQHRGATPFEMGDALSAMGIKILKKTKHFVGANQSFTVQIRDPKTRIIDRSTFAAGGNFTFGKFTQTLLFIAKPAVDPAEGTKFTWTLGTTRTYKYQVMGIKEDTSRLMVYDDVEQ